MKRNDEGRDTKLRVRVGAINPPRRRLFKMVQMSHLRGSHGISGIMVFGNTTEGEGE